MALHVDSSAANQYVDCGSASALDDWTAATFAAWCRATSLAGDGVIRRIGAKHEPIGNNGKDLTHAWHSGLAIPQDCLRIRVNRATTVAQAQSVANVVVANEWMFAVGTYDESDGPRLFKGTLTTLAAEVSYDTGYPVVGSGATTSEAGGFLAWGNRGSSPSALAGFVGDLSYALYLNRRLTLAEIRDLQYRLLFHRFTEAKAAYHFGLHAGTGSQPDISGGGNTGTVVGSATLADHVPLGPPFAFSRGWRGAFTVAAGGGKPWYAYAQQ